MKRIVCLFCALALCLGMVQIKGSAAALDPDHSCSLTLTYSRNGIVFPGLEIEIYRVAELHADGGYDLIPPFSGYPIKIHGITSQQEWQETAQTVKNFVAANQVPPCRSGVTNGEGVVVFDNLETGLYMVKGTAAQIGNDGYIFRDFMVYLPTPSNGDYDYDVEARPKVAQYTQPAGYTVVKLWKDGDAAHERPVSVSVDILKNGILQETVVLDSTNNWSYSWETTDRSGVWTVMERDIPEGYQVSITGSETTFFITNTKTPSSPGEPDDPDPTDPPVDPDPSDPPEPTDPPDDPDPSQPPDPDIPQTGDTTPLLLYAVLMCISGFGLMILGIFSLRDRRNEKKQ